MKELYSRCSKAFRADEHEFNFQGHIYVNVNATIRRLNELEVTWSFQSKHFSHEVSPTLTNSDKNQYDCFAVGELTIGDLGTRLGTGADTNADLDTAAKSAQAYAIRKAANQFGIAMYLLQNPKEESELVKYLLKADADNTEDMKEAVIRLMRIRKIDPSAANLVTEFGVSLEELKDDPEIFYKILHKENRL